MRTWPSESSTLRNGCIQVYCKLTVKTSDGRYLHFNSIEEFKRLTDFIEKSLPPYTAIEKAISDDNKSAGKKLFQVNLTDIDIEEWKKDESHIYIGRDSGDIEGSIFQNPYSLKDYDRSTAVRMYREHISSNPTLAGEVETLRGKVLGCFCSPNECHGQVLLDILYD